MSPAAQYHRFISSMLPHEEKKWVEKMLFSELSLDDMEKLNEKSFYAWFYYFLFPSEFFSFFFF